MGLCECAAVSVAVLLCCCLTVRPFGCAHVVWWSDVCVAQFTQLTRLDLDGCRKITDTGLERVVQLTQLTSLDLSSAGSRARARGEQRARLVRVYWCAAGLGSARGEGLCQSSFSGDVNTVLAEKRFSR